MRFRPYTKIFTRILGSDNIFQGKSTFAVEMEELREILQLADNNTMVLGDELCSGTETTSGMAIVAAGVKYLINRGTSFVFATHLH
jgi:DNA mismatch repair protein MutS